MEMTRISVPATVEEREELIASAQRALRHPRDHARYLLRQALGLTNDQFVNKTQNDAGAVVEAVPSAVL